MPRIAPQALTQRPQQRWGGGRQRAAATAAASEELGRSSSSSKGPDFDDDEEEEPSTSYSRMGADGSEDSRDFAVAMAKVAWETKAEDIMVLHVEPVIYWTRYMLIATVFSRPQLNAILGKMTKEAVETHDRRLSQSPQARCGAAGGGSAAAVETASGGVAGRPAGWHGTWDMSAGTITAKTSLPTALPTVACLPLPACPPAPLPACLCAVLVGGSCWTMATSWCTSLQQTSGHTTTWRDSMARLRRCHCPLTKAMPPPATWTAGPRSCDAWIQQ